MNARQFVILSLWVVLATVRSPGAALAGPVPGPGSAPISVAGIDSEVEEPAIDVNCDTQTLIQAIVTANGNGQADTLHLAARDLWFAGSHLYATTEKARLVILGYTPRTYLPIVVR